MQQLLQILTNFDNKLTGSEFCTSQYQNILLHDACVSKLRCKIRKQRLFTSALNFFSINALKQRH